MFTTQLIDVHNISEIVAYQKIFEYTIGSTV